MQLASASCYNPLSTERDLVFEQIVCITYPYTLTTRYEFKMLYSRRQTMQWIACTALIASCSPALCSSDDAKNSKLPLSSASHRSHGEIENLKAMSYNIWVDGQRGGVSQTAEVIRQAKCDIVGLQEVTNSGEELAKLTGLTFVKQKKGGILTRFLVVEASPNGLGVKIEVSPSKELWFFNVHLFHAPYQPYQLNGIPYMKDDPFISTEAEAISEANRARGEETAALISDMQIAIASGLPILVTGDFNEPSHLDWTEKAANAGKVKTKVEWPQSHALYQAGFKDAYREVHPDPLEKPGYTWTPRPSQQDILDRIDFVYCQNIKPVLAHVVGESPENADIVVSPYPSDHRAVLIEFHFE